MLNVVVVKIGDRYSPEYVNRMYSMLSRHLKMPFQMHCLTEKRIGVREEVAIITPPEVLVGWWNKAFVFSSIVPAGPLLYLDLDQLIVGDITEIVEECLNHEFSAYSDHLHWHGEKFGSAFMAFQGQAHLDLFEHFWPQRNVLKDYPGGDQVFFAKSGLLPEVFYFDELFPSGTVQSYKYDYLKRGLDETTKIVNMHGTPKAHQVAGAKLVKEHWH